MIENESKGRTLGIKEYWMLKQKRLTDSRYRIRPAKDILLIINFNRLLLD